MENHSITSSEFQRFQDQLISLKEAKYKIEEKCEFLLRNLSQSESKCQQLERELLKANDVKNKFKSAKDMDNLMIENQILRDRLSTIEGNFKLQNDVIRTECENLFSENERLKSQIETYKVTKSKQLDQNNIVDSVDNSPVHQDHEYKIRYLQHEVTKLLEEKTKVEMENERLLKEITIQKESEEELISRINSLLNEKNKLSNKCSLVEEEMNSTSCNLSKQLQEQMSNYELQLQSLKLEFEIDLEKKQLELNEEFSIKLNENIKSYENQIKTIQLGANEQQAELNIKLQQIFEENNQLKVEAQSELMKLQCDYERKIEEKQAEIEEMNCIYRVQIEKLIIEKTELQSNLDYTQEELKVVNRKNQKILKDVKKQLEKEVKLTQETQSRLEEVVSSGSQNSQTKINDYLSGVHCKMSSNNDDQSSLYSSPNTGIIDNCPLSSSPSNNIAMTDEELKNLLDKFTSVQNDFCESKRIIESLHFDKSQLIQTIERQQSIILNYIKNRGKNDPENDTDSPKHHSHSTSEALILNGLMSSQTSNFGLQSVMNKLKDSLKSISSKDLIPLGDKTVCRVTTAEVKQLQRVCEELMMRCLNLENDLQVALDLNIQLQSQLNTAL